MLRGLGHLDRTLGRNAEARTSYIEARRLYRDVQDRLGDANVLMGLGELELTQGEKNLARQHFFQAARLYEDDGLDDWRDRALERANAIE